MPQRFFFEAQSLEEKITTDKRLHSREREMFFHAVCMMASRLKNGGKANISKKEDT